MSDIRNAIENALSAMVPLIAPAVVSTSTVAASTVITTAAPHGLVSGLYVTLAGHTSTPTINGVYKITVISATKFSIPTAVTVAGSGGTVTANLYAWENIDFAPITGVPYQTGTMVRAKPDNPEMGASYRDRGFYQTDCAFPSQIGTATAEARAEAIQLAFKRGTTLTSGSTTLMVMETPYIMAGYPSPGCFIVPVRIPYEAQVTV